MLIPKPTLMMSCSGGVTFGEMSSFWDIFLIRRLARRPLEWSMAESSRFDAWAAADSYEAYMGRWSRRSALTTWTGSICQQGLDWLDLGCGTGDLDGKLSCASVIQQPSSPPIRPKHSIVSARTAIS